MKRPAHITMVNGVETSAIDIADRGLAYGDGIFETMRVIDGEIPLLPHYLTRFLNGVRVLALGDEGRLKRDFLHYIKHTLNEVKDNACLDSSIIKMMVTRGNGGRGYLPPEEATCHFIVQVFDCPTYPEHYASKGIYLRECEYRLGFQPQLSGIKHLNRLDQVLASQELYDEPEGLLLDYNDNVIEGTKSNLIVFKNDKVLTPNLNDCGVHGVLRSELLNPSYPLELAVKEDVLTLDDIISSDALAMVNSVFGIWFVDTLLLQNGKKIKFKQTANYETVRNYLAQNYSY